MPTYATITSYEFTKRSTSLTDYPLDDLSLLARYFYQQELFDEALRVLDILFTRAGLREEQRRRFIQLRMVIRQNQEEAR